MSPGTRRNGPVPTPPERVDDRLRATVARIDARKKTVAPAEARRPKDKAQSETTRRLRMERELRMERDMDVPDAAPVPVVPEETAPSLPEADEAPVAVVEPVVEVEVATVPTPPTVEPPQDTTNRAEKKARRGRREPVEPLVKEPRGPLDRVTLTMMLGSTGLPQTQKSSDHWGDPKGARLVVPPAAVVTRLFVYKLPEARELPGWVSPEDRKTRRLGAVTHVADVSTTSEVEALIVAVCHANGLPVPSRAQLDEAAVGPRRASSTPAVGNQGAADEKPAAGPEGDGGGDDHAVS